MDEFKMVEFDCKIKMQVKITDNMTDEEKKDKIIESVETVTDEASNSLDESEDYSAYIVMSDIKNIKNVKE